MNKPCRPFRRKYGEVAQRAKAPVLKTGCATHSGSSNLPLGALQLVQIRILSSRIPLIYIQEYRRKVFKRKAIRQDFCWYNKDRKIRAHVFLCVTGLLLYNYLLHEINDKSLSIKKLAEYLDEMRLG